MRRHWPLIVPFATLTAILPGCGRPMACPAGKTCLRYMAWGNPEQLGAEQRLVDDFNRQNPDLFVGLFTVPGSAYQQKATLMLASGSAPDVMRIDHYYFPALQPKGYFHDLTDFARKDPGFHESDFFPTAIAECKAGNHLYGLSTLYGGIVMYYNRSLVRAAGLEDPYVLEKRGEWTWERYRQYAKAMTKLGPDGRPEIFGTLVPGFPTLVTAIWNFGGELMAPDMRHSLVDSPATVHAYQFLADLVWRDHVAPTPAQSSNAAFTFESGKVGMVFDFMGMSPSYREKAIGFDWDICPPPRGSAPPVDVIKGNQLVMSANCRHPDAAWRFMRFYTGYEAEIELYAKIRRCFPTRIAVAESPQFLDGSRPPAHPQAFTDGVRIGRILPIDRRWAEWVPILNSEVDNLMAGRERDAGPVLVRARQKIDEALAEDPGF